MTVMKRIIILTIGLLVLLPGCNKINGNGEEAPVEEPVENTDVIPIQDVEYGFLSDGAPEELSASEQENVCSVNTFAMTAARQFGKTVAGNYVFSPVSLAYLLGMLSDGAAGQTRDEICAALGFGAEDQQEINEFCRDLMVLTKRNSSETEVLELANTCVADNEFRMKEDYRKSLHNYYDALVRNFDFLKDDVAGYINNWASDHTNGHVNNIVDQVKKEDVMFLVNGMYFKGKWAQPFSPGVRQETFYKETGEKESVDMMAALFKNARYYKGDGFQVATLDYGQAEPADYSMSFFLPDIGKGAFLPGFYDGVTLAVMLSRLDGGAIAKALSSSEKAWVYIQIPKYKIITDKSIIYDFKSLGMGTMFNDKAADFSHMSSGQRALYVSEMRHVASISIDENGCEAAAVSNAVLSDPIAPPPSGDTPPIIEFTADHPFMFLITERSTGAILFMGCYKE